MSENLENLENLDNSKVEENVESVETEETVSFVSAEEFQNADQERQKPAKKAKKPLSKGAKIGIIAGVTVAVILLITVITLVAVLLKPSGASGPVDNSVIAMVPTEINVGARGSYDNKVVVSLESFLDKSDFSCDSSKATIVDKTINGKKVKALEVAATSGEFELSFKNAKGVVEKVVVKLNGGVNVYDEAQFIKAVNDKEAIINVQTEIITTIQKGMKVESLTINGNGNIFDATAISARTFDGSKVKYGGDTVFSVASTGTGVTVNNLHIIGEKVVIEKPAEGEEEKPFSLDEFESNGAIFTAYGNDNNDAERAVLNINHCIIENGSKHVFARSADVTIKNSVLRNGADAIIAVETNIGKGAVLTVENNIISNSVVAGILFCGWTNVGNSEKTTCTLNIKGFLDIYNWKDTTTTKLVPSSEGWMADAVNNMVASQIKKYTKDKEMVSKYMYTENNEFFVHIGIIILATGAFNENKTKVVGAEDVGLVQRRFPIPSFANAFAKTCDFIGFTQSTASKSHVKPKTGYGKNANFLDMGYSIIEEAEETK